MKLLEQSISKYPAHYRVMRNGMKGQNLLTRIRHKVQGLFAPAAKVHEVTLEEIPEGHQLRDALVKQPELQVVRIAGQPGYSVSNPLPAGYKQKQTCKGTK